MPIYGYQKEVIIEKYGLLSMKVISFDLPAEQLRSIGDFLVACANDIENNAWSGGGRTMILDPEGVCIAVGHASTNT